MNGLSTASRSRLARGLPRLVSVAGILAICLGSSSRSCSIAGSSDDDDEPSFVAQLLVQDSAGQTTDSFERDELINFVLTVRNRLDRSVDVDFDTGRTSDFVVVRENTDDVVWKWSDTQPPFAQGRTTLTFSAGQTQSFPVEWNQIDSSTNNRVRDGAYEVRGVLVYDNFDANPLSTSQFGSTLERFTIN